jgi:hypothetical protein
MQRTIWKWIVDADDRVGDVALDAGLAIVLAAICTEVLQALLSAL